MYNMYVYLLENKMLRFEFFCWTPNCPMTKTFVE